MELIYFEAVVCTGLVLVTSALPELTRVAFLTPSVPLIALWDYVENPTR